MWLLSAWCILPMEAITMAAEWIAISNALAEATQNTAAHTVAVHTEARGSSSGVIWRPGIIVTAEHAVRRDEDIQVTLPDGKVASSKLVGRDPSTDLAVLKCEQATGPASSFADTGKLKPGELTLVVGRTRVSGPVVTLGVVSLVAQERHAWGGATISPYVRLDVATRRLYPHRSRLPGASPRPDPALRFRVPTRRFCMWFFLRELHPGPHSERSPRSEDLCTIARFLRDESLLL